MFSLTLQDVYKRQLIQHPIVKVIVSTFLAHVGRHTDRVEYKINLSTQYIHGLSLIHIYMDENGNIIYG